MQSLKQFFAYMNDISFEYVVLRNWDGLPYDFNLGEHSDLDLLVADFDHWKEIFPEAVAEHPYPRVRMKLAIDDSYVYVDVRHVGDDYYPEDFERAILETREWNSKGFYTPNPIHHRIALAYHAVHHKDYISKEYTRFLGDATLEGLLEALRKSSIGWIAPKDKSVGSFNGYWKGATALVTKEDGKIKKEQVNYKSYRLIQNEYEKLRDANSIHFPKVFGYDGNVITIEDCGFPIMTYVPDNWRDQIIKIMQDLKLHGIIHRDIKLDNLMVKDGVIKLIDFGWSVYVDETESKPAPSCLGYPNKPSWGYCDDFSMRAVVKQIQYELEEKGVSA